MPNDRIYEDLKIIRFYPKTPGNRDSGHQKSQVFHADGHIRQHGKLDNLDVREILRF